MKHILNYDPLTPAHRTRTRARTGNLEKNIFSFVDEEGRILRITPQKMGKRAR